jgi:cell division protein FtsB
VAPEVGRVAGKESRLPLANADAVGTTASRIRPPPGLRRALPARRALALLLFALVGFLYYRPLVAYLDAREALARRGAEVATLRQQQRALERRFRDERSPQALVREARRLAYVKPGEQLFIVKGIEQWRRERARTRAGATLREDGGR